MDGRAPNNCTMATDDAEPELARRMTRVLKHLGMNQKDAEKHLGLGAGFLSRYVTGERKSMKSSVLALFAAKGINPGWLATGTGEMLLPKAARADGPSPSPEESEDGGDGDESPLERALRFAFDPTKHILRDATVVQDVLRGTHQLQDQSTDLVEAARAWLDTAASLRKDGVQPTAKEMLWRMSVGRRPLPGVEDAARARDAALNEEAAAKAEALGLRRRGS